MEDAVKVCANDILAIINKVHYSSEFSDFRLSYGCRGEFEYIIKYIQDHYLDEVN